MRSYRQFRLWYNMIMARQTCTAKLKNYYKDEGYIKSICSFGFSNVSVRNVESIFQIKN